MTHADFTLLNLIVGWYDNPNGVHDACKEATQKMLSECPNVSRIYATMKHVCEATLAQMPQSPV
eukprot:CAMPEP_0185586214 /NCGR_PEP_ID=MMETSP0434-20130131/43134_1 /TAXON_ID=626734 ORGANISM="Favella taraikaensis, Strain Fe Narragansett Bay" /NCGR_SAMPLE_ID=MMETSP0434 /ASSEMBLY_ACC=CAM_ASM_000379 /LENGTH=63 /DNA_ID=CAMNT_0028207169 /DNA_START=223 /DNA_END=414 /DNA_ORIENTATION=-